MSVIGGPGSRTPLEAESKTSQDAHWGVTVDTLQTGTVQESGMVYLSLANWNARSTFKV